jgi:hypothetical protein
MMGQNGKVQSVATEVSNLNSRFSERAQEFLAQKERVKYYIVEGYDADGGDGYRCGELCLTDVEVARVRQLMSDAYVLYMDLPAGCYSMEQIQKEVGLWELQGQIDELDNLLFSPCEKDFFMSPEKIQLDNPVYYYQMSCHIFNEAKGLVEAPIPFRMILTDEEYVRLLSLQLKYREEFSFNNLFKMDKELALKINEWATCVFWKNASLMHCPFVVTLDEIREDAFRIDGSESSVSK